MTDMTNQISISTLKNGLTLIVEEMPDIESAAFGLAFPGGVLSDSKDRIGVSLVLAELMSRGAGNLDARKLSEAFDDIGARHSEGAGLETLTLGGMVLADKLPRALGLVALMSREATLPEEEIDGIRQLLLQDLLALQDNPARRVFTELTQRYYPEPFNRSTLGSETGLKAVNHDHITGDYRAKVTPKGAILSIAGKFNGSEVVNLAEKLFGDWEGPSGQAIEPAAMPKVAVHHIPVDAAQLQIALAFPSPKFCEEHYYSARVLNGILSGGMFGRLFIEVREKRGLCYSVYSSMSATRNFGTFYAYAGTTPERSQETLDVLVKELRSVKGTISAEELRRALANLKSGLVMSEESCNSRASSNITDYWQMGRVRSLDEILSAINLVTVDSINDCLDNFPASQMMVVTLGSRKLELN